MSILKPTITESIHARQADIVADLEARYAPIRKGFSVRLHVDDVAKLDTLAVFLGGTRSSWISDLLSNSLEEAMEAIASEDAPIQNMKVNDFTVDEFYRVRFGDLKGEKLDEALRERMEKVTSFPELVEQVEAGQ